MSLSPLPSFSSWQRPYRKPWGGGGAESADMRAPAMVQGTSSQGWVKGRVVGSLPFLVGCGEGGSFGRGLEKLLLGLRLPPQFTVDIRQPCQPGTIFPGFLFPDHTISHDCLFCFINQRGHRGTLAMTTVLCIILMAGSSQIPASCPITVGMNTKHTFRGRWEETHLGERNHIFKCH